MSANHRHVEEEDEKELGGLLGLLKSLVEPVQDALLTPFRLALSKTALRAYLTTALVISTTIILLGFAVTAYTLFYWSYVPRIGFERTIHLQFDNVFQIPMGAGYDTARALVKHDLSPYPYGTTTLTPDIVSQQNYDVVIELTVPRTQENRDAGNFMLDVSMHAPEDKTTSSGILGAVKDGIVSSSSDNANILARSRRPAILAYRSGAVEQAYKLTELHLYLMGWRQESEKLRVGMFEDVAFPKGWRNVPATLRLEVQSSHRMQIYSAKALFRARFTGLRWLMYNHRVFSAFIFIGGFWTTEMIFAGLAWAVLVMSIAPPSDDVKAEEVHEVAEGIKRENEDGEEAPMSDTERWFPTLSGQKPLRYRSSEIKEEEQRAPVALQDVPAVGAEADVEDEEDDFFVDSGLGTSMESSSGRRDSVRKRRGRSSTRS